MTLINTNDSFWCTTIITKYRTNSTQHIHTKKGLGLAIIQVYQNANCSSSYINIWGVLSTYSITKKKVPLQLAIFQQISLLPYISSSVFLVLDWTGYQWGVEVHLWSHYHLNLVVHCLQLGCLHDHPWLPASTSTSTSTSTITINSLPIKKQNNGDI